MIRGILYQNKNRYYSEGRGKPLENFQQGSSMNRNEHWKDVLEDGFKALKVGKTSGVETSQEATALKKKWGASLVVQWLRICPPVQKTWVLSLAWEDPTKPLSHNCWAWALEPMLQVGEATAIRSLLVTTRKTPHSNKEPGQAKVSK